MYPLHVCSYTIVLSRVLQHALLDGQDKLLHCKHDRGGIGVVVSYDKVSLADIIAVCVADGMLGCIGYCCCSLCCILSNMLLEHSF